MKSNVLRVVLLSVVFLFFLQMAGTLIESVYILDLLNTSLDEKALGLLFFFAPVLLFVFRGKHPRWLLPATLGVVAISRAVTPYLSTVGRLFSAGIGVGAVLWLLVLLLQKGSHKRALETSVALALAIALSVLLRTVGAGLDYSLTVPGGWMGGLLAVAMLASFWFLQRGEQSSDTEGYSLNFSSAFGLMIVLTLLFFSFSAPSVISRWVDGNYAFIVLVVSLLSLAYAAVGLLHAEWIESVLTKKSLLIVGNLFLTLSVLSMFLVHRVAFPVNTDAVVIVTSPTFLQQIPLMLTLLSFPILFVDATAFMRVSQPKKNSSFTVGLLVGTLVMVVTVFMLVFTNIWGYVKPISPYFRNQFYLPFLLLSAGITLGIVFVKPASEDAKVVDKTIVSAYFPAALAVCFVVTGFFTLWTTRTGQAPVEKTSLTALTYNIQQANDEDGRKSYLRQLEIIREIDPDIIAFQESDSARIGLNNNDYVRFYASQLGYYSYFGPATSTGTYGTAILSRYPLENAHVIFSYSDQDEIGTTAVEIVVGGHRFSVFNVHPAGKDVAKLAFADAVLAQAEGHENVIILGDFNLRNTDEAYQRFAAVYHNVPGSEGHIDHIFLSHNLQLVNPVYVPAPQSATDHPLLYATITWE